MAAAPGMKAKKDKKEKKKDKKDKQHKKEKKEKDRKNKEEQRKESSDDDDEPLQSAQDAPADEPSLKRKDVDGGDPETPGDGKRPRAEEMPAGDQPTPMATEGMAQAGAEPQATQANTQAMATKDAAHVIGEPQAAIATEAPEAATEVNSAEEEAAAANFWDEVEGAAGSGEKADARGGEGADSKGAQTGLRPDGAGRWQVPSESVDELVRKLEPLALRSGASLVMQGTKLHITGGPVERKLALRFARAVVDGRVDAEEHPDMTTLAVSAEWAGSWRGQEVQIERDMDAMIFFEDLRPKHLERYEIGQVLEAQRDGGSRWLMATMLGNAGPRRIRVRWSSDGTAEELDIVHARVAPRIGIIGSLRSRLGAQVNVMSALEASNKGSIAAQLLGQHSFGGLALESIELPVKPTTMWKLENSPMLSYLLQATGCMALELFLHPKLSGGSVDSPCALLAGSREQRWQAGQILAAFAAGMDNRRLQGLPLQLTNDCRVVGVPRSMMGDVLGKAMCNLVRLMESTDTFIFPLREREARKSDEMDELLETVFDAKTKKEPISDIAVFGRPMARLAAEVKVMIQVEVKHPGYYQTDGQNQTEITDPAEGLGIDRAWISEDFESESAPKRRSETLAGAAGCLVESEAKLVLLAGTKEARARGREYLRLSTSRRCNHRLSVPDLERRRDAVHLQVPQEVAQHPWLNEQWEKLGLDTKTVIFYDGVPHEGNWDRLVIMGALLQRRGKTVAEMLQQAKNLVDKAIIWTKRKWDLSKEEGARPEDLKEPEPLEEMDNKGKGNKGKGLGKGKGTGEGKGPSKGKEDLHKGDGKGKDGKGGKADSEKGKGKSKVKWEFLQEVEKQEIKGKGKSKTKSKLRGKSRESLTDAESAGALDPKDLDVPSEPMLASGGAPERGQDQRGQEFGPHGAQVPFTPGPGAGTAPGTPTVQRGFGPHSNAAPQTPAMAPHRKRSFQMSQDDDGDLFPNSGIAAPSTPAVGGIAMLKLGTDTGSIEGARKPRDAVQPANEAKTAPKKLKGAPPPKMAAVNASRETSAGAPFRGTPPPKHGLGPSVVAAGPSTPGSAAPWTPAGARPPASARVGGVAPPQTPSLAVAPPQTPAVARLGSLAGTIVPGPQTPFVARHVPQPETPAVGVPPPETPATGKIQAPRTPAPGSGIVPGPQTPASGIVPGPQTPAIGGLGKFNVPQTPRPPPTGPKARGLPGPQTPAFEALVGGEKFLARAGILKVSSKVAPATPGPALTSGTLSRGLRPQDSSDLVPITPAPPRANVPITPAPPRANASTVPQTPVVPFQQPVGHSASAGGLGSSVHQRPAAIKNSDPPQVALVSPQTPAAITGSSGRSAPGGSAPATPAAITGRTGKAAPQTPAAIRGAGVGPSAPKSPS